MIPTVILCGGLGTRISDIYKDTPKSLIPINDKPFIDIQIDQYLTQGITDFYLCLGHMGDKIEKHVLNQGYFKKARFKFLYDKTPNSGTGGAVKNASKLITGPFFVAYGDVYLDINLIDFFKSYKISKGPMMAVYKNNNSHENSNCWFENNKLKYLKNSQGKCNYIDYGIGIYEESYFPIFEHEFDLSAVQEKFSINSALQHYINPKKHYEIGSLKCNLKLAKRLKKI